MQCYQGAFGPNAWRRKQPPIFGGFLRVGDAFGNSAALPLGRHVRPPGRMRDASLCSARALAQPSGRGLNEGRKLSGAHAACITTACRLRAEAGQGLRYRKRYQSILGPNRRPGRTPGTAVRYHRNNKPPQKRGFEGLVGVDAPPAEVSGNLVLAGRIRDLLSDYGTKFS